jgi:cold shock CspA family protein
MTKRMNKWNVLLAGVAGGMLSLSGVAKAAPAVEEGETNTANGQTRTQLVHTTASVTAINRSTRSVTLKKDDGEETMVHAPDAVKQFDTLKVGDKVDVDYYESLAVSMAPTGSKPSMTERKGRAVDIGGGVQGRELNVSAEVVSVDPSANTVTIKGPKGNIRTIYVADSALQQKLPSVKPGQVVQFTYTEAVAATIRPSSK